MTEEQRDEANRIAREMIEDLGKNIARDEAMEYYIAARDVQDSKSKSFWSCVYCAIP